MKKETQPVRKGLWDKPIPDFIFSGEQETPVSSPEQKSKQGAAHTSGDSQLK
ncbi:MAG: hypothetical protein PHT34_00745 [Oscillospiraceae bacterium]|nr:hypothetical protein [Oscillospiraceae bacterium]